MFYVKALEYMKSNRALQLWHKMRNDEIEILKDFAVWLDEQSAEHSAQVDVAALCEHGKGHCQCDNTRCRNYCD